MIYSPFSFYGYIKGGIDSHFKISFNCLFVCLYVYHLSVCLSMMLFVYLFCQSVLSLCLSFLSFCIFCLCFLCLSVCLSFLSFCHFCLSVFSVSLQFKNEKKIILLLLKELDLDMYNLVSGLIQIAWMRMELIQVNQLF